VLLLPEFVLTHLNFKFIYYIQVQKEKEFITKEFIKISACLYACEAHEKAYIDTRSIDLGG